MHETCHVSPLHFPKKRGKGGVGSKQAHRVHLDQTQSCYVEDLTCDVTSYIDGLYIRHGKSREIFKNPEMSRKSTHTIVITGEITGEYDRQNINV
jgi:hypothetical protein